MTTNYFIVAVKHFSAALVVEWWMTLLSQLWKCCHNIVTDRLSCGCTEHCGERGAISGCWLAAFFRAFGESEGLISAEGKQS